MKKQSYSFPSVYEAIGTDLSYVSKDLINGLQLYDEKEQPYIIGDLALNEGVSPNKLVNSSPYEIDYQLLLKSGILLANHNNNRPLAITTGFPFSTYQVYKDIAKDLILNLDTIDYNPGTYTNRDRTKVKANIQQVEILPEMIGNIIALRVGDTQAEGNFFVVSLGYGTCEAVLSTENGIVHRTALSINGMQYAVDLFMRSLATKYYLGLKTEKQLDVSFRNDFIILDRQKINIVDLRKRILERYYKDIISTGLRRSFTDSDFERADKIYLTGGGALFPELIAQFEKEFSQIAKVEVVKNPLTLTSEGYSLNSIMLTGGDQSTAIGLDVGNANTVLTQYESGSALKDTEEVEKIEVKKVAETPVEEPVKKEEPAEIKSEPEVEDKYEEEAILETQPEIEEKEEIVEIEETPEVKEEENSIEDEIEKSLNEELSKHSLGETVEKQVIEEEEEEEYEEELSDEKSYEEKLAELSEEEKIILNKEINRNLKSENIDNDEEDDDIPLKGSSESYEPDFS